MGPNQAGVPRAKGWIRTVILSIRPMARRRLAVPALRKLCGSGRCKVRRRYNESSVRGVRLTLPAPFLSLVLWC